MSERLSQSSRRLLQIVSTLLTVSLLVQFFIAGMAAMTNPEWWTYHLTWVAIFQWLVVPLPILAWLGAQPRRLRVTLAIIPLLQTALQYFLVHRALEGRLAIGVGLHAMNGAVMLIVTTLLALGYADQNR